MMAFHRMNASASRTPEAVQLHPAITCTPGYVKNVGGDSFSLPLRMAYIQRRRRALRLDRQDSWLVAQLPHGFALFSRIPAIVVRWICCSANCFTIPILSSQWGGNIWVALVTGSPSGYLSPHRLFWCFMATIRSVEEILVFTSSVLVYPG